MSPSSRRRSSILWLSLLLAACGDDGSVATTGPEDSTGGSTASTLPTGVVDDSGDGPSAETTDGGQTTGDTGFDPPVPACGNGYVEADEECDDGNADDDDGCNSACQVPCGLQWSTLALGPTLDSEIVGLSVARDPADQIVVSGRLREITVEMDGTVIEGDDTVLVQSYDPVGGFVWEQVLSTADGDALPAGVAIDSMGDVYVAATLDAAGGGTAIRAIKLAAADGMEIWTHDFDGPMLGEDDRVFDIAVGPDGQPVISGEIRVADGDDDVWVRKLDAVDGTEVWTETYTGVGTVEYSVDDGGPMAIGPDGAIFVLAGIYVDFETLDRTLLRFEAGGGPPTWTFTPSMTGSVQVFDAAAVAVDGDGAPAMIVERSGASLSGWLYRLDAQGQEVWSRTHTDFEIPDEGADWRFEGLAFDGGELVVLGRYLDDQTLPGSAWWEPSVVRLDAADATVRCQRSHEADGGGLIPPSLRTFGVTTASDGSAVVTGEQSSPDEAALWLGGFRP